MVTEGGCAAETLSRNDSRSGTGPHYHPVGVLGASVSLCAKRGPKGE